MRTSGNFRPVSSWIRGSAYASFRGHTRSLFDGAGEARAGNRSGSGGCGDRAARRTAFDSGTQFDSPAIRDINVTMGYPMRDSAFFAFMQQVSAMQLHLRQKDGQWYYYHRQVWSLFLPVCSARSRSGMKPLRQGSKPLRKQGNITFRRKNFPAFRCLICCSGRRSQMPRKPMRVRSNDSARTRRS